MPRQQSIPNGSRCRLGVHTRSSHKIDRLGLESRSFETSFADARTTCREEDGFPFWHEHIEWRPCHRSWARARAFYSKRTAPQERPLCLYAERRIGMLFISARHSRPQNG